MTEILKTKDYSIFKKHESNRKIYPQNLKNIKFSIQCRNMLDMRPISVDSEMRVLDGQHRLQAAKELDLDIYYQIKKNSKDEDIILLNINQKPWGYEEYLNFYVSKNMPTYVRISDFCRSNSIKLDHVLKIILNSGNNKKRFKSGTLDEVKNDVFEEIKNNFMMTEFVIKHLKTYILSDTKYFHQKMFFRGLSQFLRNPINLDVFLGKLKVKSDSVKQCTSVDSYIKMWTDIYNWKNQKPI